MVPSGPIETVPPPSIREIMMSYGSTLTVRPSSQPRVKSVPENWLRPRSPGSKAVDRTTGGAIRGFLRVEIVAGNPVRAGFLRRGSLGSGNIISDRIKRTLRLGQAPGEHECHQHDARGCGERGVIGGLLLARCGVRARPDGDDRA